MKYRMVMILSVLFLFSVVGCKADTPNIKELEGYWVSDHHCVEKEYDVNYINNTRKLKYISHSIILESDALGRAEIEYICKSSCKKGITIVRKNDGRELGTFVVLQPNKIQFISEDDKLFTYKDTYTKVVDLKNFSIKDQSALFHKHMTEGPDDNRPK